MSVDQSSVDLLQVVGGNLKRAARTKGGEYAGACPFCGGHDRFRVWPEKGYWWCRQCERRGDAIAFVQTRYGLDFRGALAHLGLNGHEPTRQPAAWEQKPPEPSEPVEPPPVAWQAKALAFVERAEAALWGGEYPRPLGWLRGRGFTENSIAEFRLGYNPEDRWVKREDWGLEPGNRLWLPSGIVIPWFVDGQLWKLFIRRADGKEPKHYQVPGGSNAMFNADALECGKPSVLVESALDAIAIQQEAGDLVTAVATGTTGARHMKWGRKLKGCTPHLLAFDRDEGGNAPRKYWQDVLQPDAMEWQPDIDDAAAMLQQGYDIRAWIEQGLRLAAGQASPGGVLNQSPAPVLVVVGNDVEGWYVCEQDGNDLLHWFEDERSFAGEEAARQAAEMELATLGQEAQ